LGQYALILLVYAFDALPEGFRELPGAVRQNFGKSGPRPCCSAASNGPLEFVQVLLN
jgi:hypothetical protein